MWAKREGNHPSYVRDVLDPNPKAGEVEIGDEVVLRREDAPDIDIFVRVEKRRGESLSGAISRANRISTGGDTAVAKDARVDFLDLNVIRLVKQGATGAT